MGQRFVDWLEVVKGGVDEQPSPNTRRSSEALAAEVAEENPAYLTAWLLDFLSDDHASPDAQNAMATA